MQWLQMICALSDQSLLCHNIGQGQPKVIMYINYDGQEFPGLQTNFHRNQSKGFTIYGHGGHLGHVIWTIYIILIPGRLRIKLSFVWPSLFSGIKL